MGNETQATSDAGTGADGTGGTSDADLAELLAHIIVIPKVASTAGNPERTDKQLFE